MKASNLSFANLSNSPFVFPAQPISGTVLISCPRNSCFNLLGRHSSNKTFTISGQEGFLEIFKCLGGLLTGNGGKIFEELIQGLAFFEVINQSLHKHTGSHKYKNSPKNFQRAANDSAMNHKIFPPQTAEQSIPYLV